MSKNQNLFKLNFDNHFAKLGDDFFSEILPTPLQESSVVAFSSKACELINLNEKEILSSEFLEAISAKKPHPEFCYLAMLYAGHQFGHLVPQLGDGRAVLLAQIKNQKNESWDLVLKGSGLTPYSRMGDGKAVLRSSIREFLASEAMFNLGIPTSRALCLIASKDVAIREEIEPAAQIIRMSESHIRFGSFEVFFYRQQNDKVKILADYAIEKHFPHFKNDPEKYQLFLCEVVISTAKTIAYWQAFGFCHGVMNTDNMSILGITFDYGPFGFLDEYNPDHICNSSDYQGRYSFANQPKVGLWNLHAFSITLSSFIEMKDQQKILSIYEEVFFGEYQTLMAKKLGFEKFSKDVEKLVKSLLLLLKKYRVDYSFFFRNLAKFEIDKMEKFIAKGDLGLLQELSKDEKNNFENELKIWLENYSLTLKNSDSDVVKNHKSRLEAMNKINPKFILRNYLLQNAIEKAVKENDFSEVKKLQKIMESPFSEQIENDDYAKVPPAWSQEIRISCSS